MSDITDFSAGIVTDIDPQDGGAVPSSARDLDNMDTWPGSTEKRYGTKAYTWPRTGGGVVPDADEEVIQICVVYAPFAKASSVKGFPQASERCLNPDVTVILVRNNTTGKYRLYADSLTANSFTEALTPDGTGWFEGSGDDIPFMIPRIGGVGIGNVKIFNTQTGAAGEIGVLWYGHIKKLIGWHYDTVGNEYKYLLALDEWRLSNAECYDAAGTLQCRVVIANYDTLWNNLQSPNHLYFEDYPIPDTNPVEYYTPEQVLNKAILPYLIGQEERKFNLKVTAMYDGFQESRPLTWADQPYIFQSIKNTININGPVYATPEMPENWTVKIEGDSNQVLRFELGSPNNFAEARYVHADDPDGEYFPYPLDNESITIDGNIYQLQEHFFWTIKLRWRETWGENKAVDKSGEGFEIIMIARWNDDQSFQYGYDWDGQTRQNIKIDLAHPLINKVNVPQFWAWALGQDVGSYNEVIAKMNAAAPGTAIHECWGTIAHHWNDANVIEGRRVCRELFEILEITYERNPNYDTSAIPESYLPFVRVNELDEFYLGTHVMTTSMVFSLKKRVGVGMIYLQPIIPREMATEAPDTELVELINGSRRLTGFRIYAKQDIIDIDYVLIDQVNLDYNVGDPDHGGSLKDPEDGIIGHRTGTYTGTSPTWMDLGYWIAPYIEEDPVTGHVIGGACRKFVISHDKLRTSPGRSTLSSNLLRDEKKTDKPQWKRGSICQGRLLALHAVNGEMAYCVMAGGVVQYDIMPETIHISKGETLTHIVSWRGNHHLVFTDQNIWRINLGSGDVLSWGILDTYAQQGTALWKTIVDTPQGIFYASHNGVFLYDGNRPNSIVRDRWEKDYLKTWAPLTGRDKSFAGYDSTRGEVYFRATDATGNKQVWVYNLNRRAWRRYVYAADKQPAYMAMHRTTFIQSFGAGDARERNMAAYTDLGTAYGCQVLTQEVQPIDETTLQYFQYMGLRYEGPVALPARVALTFAPYKHQIHPSKVIALNGQRIEYFFPIPLGISRNMRIRFGQGSFFGDTNSPDAVILSSVSFRGAPFAQWKGTR